MKKESEIQMDSIDILALRHILNGALASFQTAHEILLEKKGNRIEAKIAFDSAEANLKKVLAILTIKRNTGI